MTNNALNQLDLALRWQRLPRWVRWTLSLVDVALNIKIGHDPYNPETISARLARDRNAGGSLGKAGCALLDKYDAGHCDRALITPNPFGD